MCEQREEWIIRILLIANGIAGIKAEGLAGGDSRLIEIARHWARAGHELHLMSGPAGVDLFQRRIPSITPHVARWWGKNGRWWFALRAITVSVLLPWSLLRLNPQVIVNANDQLFDVLPGFMLKLWYRKRVKWVVTVLWLPSWKFWRRQGPRWYHSLAFLLTQRLSLFLAALLADRTLAVARGTARQLRRTGYPMRRVATVGCGVNLAAPRAVKPSQRARRWDAVSVGRLAAAKGVFDLIDAWALVVARKPGAKLAIIGDGPDRAMVQARVRRRGLAENVDLLGAVDTDEKNRCVSASRLFTLPSHEESWSIAMGEAMALGVPVVAYDLPELLEVWGDAYQAVPEGDIPVLAKSILSLLEDEPARRKLARRGLARVSELDWSVIAERELELLMGELSDEDPLGADANLVASSEPQGSSRSSYPSRPNATAK